MAPTFPQKVGRVCGLITALVLCLCVIALALTGTAKLIMLSGILK